jgi:hypothetical protein
VRHWTITNRVSGHVLGTYAGDDELGALDAMAREAGYADRGEARRVSFAAPDAEELVVEPGVSDEQIATLEREAGEAGDLEQVELCRRARLDMGARRACARVILDAQGSGLFVAP